MGLLDFNYEDPKSMGLLALAQGLFKAGAPQTRRVGLGEALSGGLGNMAQAQQQARDQQMKTQNDMMGLEMNRMQLDQNKSNILAKQKAAEFQAQIPQIINHFGNDYQGMIKAGVPQELVKSIAESANYGRAKVARTMDVEGQDGSKLTRQFDEYGNAVGGDVNAYVAPQSINLGNQTIFAKPKAGQSFNMGMSPDAMAANARGWAGLNQNERQFQENKGLKERELELKGSGKKATEDMTKASQVASFDTMLDSLDRLGNHKGLSRSVGLYSATPTLPGSESANFQAELDTFQSQAFIPMVSQLKGMGALSDAEGKKLTAAVGALNPKMSEPAFRSSLKRIMSDMETARARVSGIKKSGASGGWGIEEIK